MGANLFLNARKRLRDGPANLSPKIQPKTVRWVWVWSAERVGGSNFFSKKKSTLKKSQQPTFLVNNPPFFHHSTFEIREFILSNP